MSGMSLGGSEARSEGSSSAQAGAVSSCSTPRSTAGCALRWRRRVWRKCDSVSISRGPRSCSDELHNAAQSDQPSERRFMKSLDQLSVKIFGDGAELSGMLELYRQPHIKGFTTNPTLMRKAGISDYR